MQLQLTRKKKTGRIVGLDIEAGSIAATEVAVNGSARVTASAIARCSIRAPSTRARCSTRTASRRR